MVQARELSTLRKQVIDLNEMRTEAVSRVINTKPYIAAQVYERYRTCGKPNCKCNKGTLHGPFLWIYQRKKGHKVISTTVTVGKKAEAKKLAERYVHLLAIRQQIRETDQKINTVLNEIEALLEKEIAEYVERKAKA